MSKSLPLAPPLAPLDAPEREPDLEDLESTLRVCRKLRTKLAFTPLVDAAGAPLLWQRGDGSTAVYWCLGTMECAGLDDGLVHATLCRAGRGCYQPPD